MRIPFSKLAISLAAGLALALGAVGPAAMAAKNPKHPKSSANIKVQPSFAR